MSEPNIRKTVYGLLTADPTLTALVPSDRWYERGAVPDSPQVPYGVLAWQGTDGPRWGHVRLLDVFVHDARGDYGIIEDALNRARVLLEAAAQYSSVLGVRMTQADWQTRSADLFDDATGTGMMFDSWKIVGS